MVVVCGGRIAVVSLSVDPNNDIDRYDIRARMLIKKWCIHNLILLTVLLLIILVGSHAPNMTVILLRRSLVPSIQTDILYPGATYVCRNIRKETHQPPPPQRPSPPAPALSSPATAGARHQRPPAPLVGPEEDEAPDRDPHDSGLQAAPENPSALLGPDSPGHIGRVPAGTAPRPGPSPA